MIYILLTLIVIGLVAVGIAAVVGYFNSSGKAEARKARADLADANERVSVAQTALIEIASGDAMPVLRAADALATISKTYTKGITK